MMRFAKWLLVLLVILLGVSLFWEPLVTTRYAPPPTHKYDARIVRDEFGVPHIFGKTDADASTVSPMRIPRTISRLSRKWLR